MNRFSRTHLSPDVAIRNLDAAYAVEKSRIAEVIALIAVIDERRDYLDAGYSCMRNYCRDRLKMTVDEAARRVQVARAALKFPELFEYLADGRLCVTTASMLAPCLAPETASALLAGAAYRSKLEVVQLLAAHSRRIVPTASGSNGEANVQNTSERRAPEHVTEHEVSLSDLCAAAACGSLSHVPKCVEHSRLGRVSPAPSGGFDVRLTITTAEHDELCRLQALLGHAIPTGDPALVYAYAIRLTLAHAERQRLGAKPGAAPAGEPKGRGIPKALRRLVWERDGGRCSFVGADGHRCGETFRLEFDHIIPVALGGRTTPENLRLLCRAHNQHEAARTLGKEHVRRRRELAQRERARDKAASAASAARDKARTSARDAAIQRRRDDLHGALRGLGFKQEEARRGAALADTMPEATLEESLRQALHELTRPVALRGERMARSTA